MIYRDAYDELFHDLEVRAREAVTASAEAAAAKTRFIEMFGELLQQAKAGNHPAADITEMEQILADAAAADSSGDWGRVSARIAAFEKSSSGPEV